MPLEEPSWWYAQEPGPLAGLLQPLGQLYGWIAQVRYERTEPYRSRLPVVCVGNFTAGGTGKTPLTLHLCRLLLAKGQHPVALTRGYGGNLPGPYWIDAARDHAVAVGDEAMLLAAATPTMLARDRGAGARAIENGPHTATAIVMDDGLQNPSLVKDLAIAVIDGKRGFGNGRTIPAGPLRAPLPFQLDLTDAIVVNEPANGDGVLVEKLRHQFAGAVLRASAAPAEDAGWLKGASIIAWAGIGAPQRFFALLASLGADLIAQRVFPDHHPLTPAEATSLLAMADRSSAQLVTTEKDMARLAGAGGAAAELRMRSRALPIRLKFSNGDEERLGELVASAMLSRRG